jgi:hypothetical protein
MKYVNYVLSIGLSIGSLIMFFNMHDKLDVMYFIILMLSGVLFMSFAIVEERNEEVNELRKTIHYMVKKHGL